MAEGAKRKTGTIAMIGAAVLLVLTIVLVVMQSTEREELPAPNHPEAITPVQPDLQVTPDVTQPSQVPPPNPQQPPRTE
jgi:hypothetical protein